jgi:hypothetical protein
MNPSGPSGSQRPAMHRGYVPSTSSSSEIHGGRLSSANMAGLNRPQCMSPTASLRAQSSTPQPHDAASPTASSVGRSKAWVKSTAKRVGIVSSTPRTKLGGRIYKRLSPRKSALSKAMDTSPNQVMPRLLLKLHDYLTFYFQSHDTSSDTLYVGLVSAEKTMEETNSVVGETSFG